MDSERTLLVYGAKEFGLVVSHLASDCGYLVAGFIDDWNNTDAVLGSWEDVRRTFSPDKCVLALAIGYKHLDARFKLYRRLIADGYRFPPLVHPRSNVHGSAQIGAGAMVMSGAIVDVNARVGDCAVIWPGAVINHDSQVGENSFISPNATICGISSIGSDCFVGAGAVVVDHVVLEPKSFIKAGSVYKATRALK